MELTETERDIVANVLAPRSKELDLRWQLLQERIAERRRRAAADRDQRELLARGLLGPAGGDLDETLERNASVAQAFLERQRATIIDHSDTLAERHEALARSWQRKLLTEQRFRDVGYQLTALDRAASIGFQHAPPDSFNEVDVQIPTPTPQHNVAKVYQFKRSRPDPSFHIPGLWIVHVDWVFKLDVTADVLLNAVTFVQALGADSLYTAGWLFGDSFAQANFSTRFAMFAVGPPPQQVVHPLGPGDRDDGPERSLHSDWWDLLGTYESAVYDYQSTLIDGGFNPVSAGSTVFFVVTAELVQCADGAASCLSDFRDGGLQLNVPAVYVSTFLDNPIP